MGLPALNGLAARMQARLGVAVGKGCKQDFDCFLSRCGSRRGLVQTADGALKHLLESLFIRRLTVALQITFVSENFSAFG